MEFLSPFFDKTFSTDCEARERNFPLSGGAHFGWDVDFDLVGLQCRMRRVKAATISHQSTTQALEGEKNKKRSSVGSTGVQRKAHTLGTDRGVPTA